jgi:hypothetical protein
LGQQENGNSVSTAVRTALAARLQERRPEIEKTILSAITESANLGGDIVRAGLRVALADALDRALEEVETGGGQGERASDFELPPSLFRQVRLAARSGVGLDTTLRRFVAAGATLGEFVLQEARALPDFALATLQREQGVLLDRTLATVAEIYRRVEQERGPANISLAERIQRILAGDPEAAEGYSYPFGGWHLAAIARGSGAENALRSIAAESDLTLLALPREGELIWAWFGGHGRINAVGLLRIASGLLPENVSLVTGESHRGLDGWRLSHREARAALRVMLLRPGKVIQSSSVILLSALLGNSVLTELIRDIYLRPLEAGDAGVRMRRTLRAYIDTGFNAASTSATLGIDRSTVQRHLRRAEELLGRHLNSCIAELKLALELEDLDSGDGSADDASE